MDGEKLHEFGLDLCDHILGQFRPYLRELPERLISVPSLDVDEWNMLDLPNWLGRGVAGLPRPLADHVWAGVDGEKVLLPLNDQELSALGSLADDPPMRLEDRCVWESFPSLYRRYVECVSEIGSALTKQTAEEWAGNSINFATRLCADQMSVADGIGIVRDWLAAARQLQAAMGALCFLPYPLGTHPTPMSPKPLPTPVDRPGLLPVAAQSSEQEKSGQKPPVARESAVCGWREVMEVTGLKKTKVYELFARGVLKGYKDGKMIRFYRAGLVGYMRERENNLVMPPRSARRSAKPGTPTQGTTRFKFL